jgi:hypothetical protein
MLPIPPAASALFRDYGGSQIHRVGQGLLRNRPNFPYFGMPSRVPRSTVLHLPMILAHDGSCNLRCCRYLRRDALDAHHSHRR